MMDFHTRFRQLLIAAVDDTDIPVLYELFRKEEDIPCVSYIEMVNGCFFHGDTLSYSDIAFRVNVWAKEIKDIQPICEKIDAKLQTNGFTRTSSIERVDGDILCKTLTYQGIGWEY